MAPKSKSSHWATRAVKIECPFCERYFVHLHALKSHVGKVHKEYCEDFLQYVNNEEDDYEQDNSPTMDSNAVNPDRQDESSRREGQNLSDGNAAQAPRKSSQKGRQSKSPILPVVPATPTVSEFHHRPVTKVPEQRQVPSKRPYSNEELPGESESSFSEPGIRIPIGTLTLCRFCHEPFYDEKYLLMHIRQEHAEDLVDPTELVASQVTLEDAEDEDDSKSFERSGGMQAARKRKLGVVKRIRHVKTKIAKTFDPMFTCRFCSKYFYNKEVLKRHTKTFHGIGQRGARPLETPATLGGAAQHQSRSSLQLSENEFHNDRNLRSNHEVEDVKTQDALRTNLVATYQCPLCPLTITAATDELLITHVMNEHEEFRGKRVKCKYCPRVLDSRHGVLRAIVPHTRTHEEEKPFTCDFCEKRFRQSHQKLKHENIHSKAKSMGT